MWVGSTYCCQKHTVQCFCSQKLLQLPPPPCGHQAPNSPRDQRLEAAITPKQHPNPHHSLMHLLCPQRGYKRVFVSKLKFPAKELTSTHSSLHARLDCNRLIVCRSIMTEPGEIEPSHLHPLRWVQLGFQCHQRLLRSVRWCGSGGLPGCPEA